MSNFPDDTEAAFAELEIEIDRLQRIEKAAKALLAVHNNADNGPEHKAAILDAEVNLFAALGDKHAEGAMAAEEIVKGEV